MFASLRMRERGKKERQNIFISVVVDRDHDDDDCDCDSKASHLTRAVAVTFFPFSPLLSLTCCPFSFDRYSPNPTTSCR